MRALPARLESLTTSSLSLTDRFLLFLIVLSGLPLKASLLTRQGRGCSAESAAVEMRNRKQRLDSDRLRTRVLQSRIVDETDDIQMAAEFKAAFAASTDGMDLTFEEIVSVEWDPPAHETTDRRSPNWRDDDFTIVGIGAFGIGLDGQARDGRAGHEAIDHLEGFISFGTVGF
jgi:hypothetical protein